MHDRGHRPRFIGRNRSFGRLSAVLLALFVAAPSVRGDEPSFPSRVLEVVESAFPARDCKLDRDALVCGDVTLGLENLRRTIVETGAEGDVVDAMILQFFGLAEAEALIRQNKASTAAPQGALSWNDAAERLRPQLVPADYRKQLGKKNVEAFLPGVLVAMAVDAPDRYRFVLDQDLKEWSVTRRAVRERALGNLAAASASLALEATPPENPELPGRWLSIAEDDGFAAARILIPSVRKRIADLLGDPFFIAIPNRDFVVAWSRDFAFHLEFMSRVKEDFESRNHPLSPAVFVGSAESIRQATTAELVSGVQFDWGDEDPE